VRLPRLIGMVHLRALPGSPAYQGSLDEVLERAVADARTLTEAGFDAIMIENFGDAPFFPGTVPAATIAAMTRAVQAVAEASNLPLGVNVLRNDAVGALAVAAATRAAMIRVNVLSGTMFTDQGPIVGLAAEVARARKELGIEVAVLADVFVKHATPPPGLTIEDAAIDTWERAGADALVISGSGTGRPIDTDDLERVHAAVPKAPLVIGSGADQANIAGLLKTATSIIVGSSLKPLGDVSAPVDATLAARLVAAAR
jgi:uncharacterized protein